jgi:sterol desaturase/sphingolipid hydroxylase (fatty acid hydroxylase superfamily)
VRRPSAGDAPGKTAHARVMPHLDWTTGALALLRAHLGDYGARAFGGFASLPVLALLFAWLERIRPLVRQRPRPSDTDLAYYLSSPCFDLLSRGAAALCMAAWATLAGTQQQSALLSGFGPVVEQPRGLIWVEMLLLLELLAYGSHRLFHSVPFLWRFHAVHHSSTRMGWLSAVRRHPFNDLVSHCLNATVLFALGFPIDVAMQVLPLIAMHALLTHSNLDWRFGKLSSVLVSPIYHRFHHTLPHEAGDKNFAALFPVIDKLFGTYHLPKQAPGVLGVEGDAMPPDFIGQLAYPFAAGAAREAFTPAEVEGA